MWKWIGEGRDAEDELTDLYSHWLTHKEEQDQENNEMAGTPPPRAYVQCCLKPSHIMLFMHLITPFPIPNFTAW